MNMPVVDTPRSNRRQAATKTACAPLSQVGAESHATAHFRMAGKGFLRLPQSPGRWKAPLTRTASGRQ